MNLNVRGYFILSQEVAELSMIPRKSGRIVNLVSIAGLGGKPADMYALAYSTSKKIMPLLLAHWLPSGAGMASTSMRSARASFRAG
jgi:NAD(P)-dependent dehydrogenase (short-subunit alcohol dehydrogenase family)